VAASPEEARALLARGRDDTQVGVILITERLAQQIQREVDAARSEGTRPFILEIPDLKGPVPESQSLLERLRSMMGIPQ
jgi:vacuolar-type H+-ATPase subunit F/Vma7